MEDPKVVNPGVTYPDLVKRIDTSYTTPSANEGVPYADIFNSLLQKGAPVAGNERVFPVVPSAEVDLSGRYPRFYPGMDNEEIYAQSQGGWEKAKNGVIKMAGTALATFIDNTAGLVYGIDQSTKEGKIKPLYDNDITNSLNEWTSHLEDKYAHYKTLRERNGHWWEPANLFTGNFLWDNIVKNLGFSIGAYASGFAWAGALKAIGLTGKIMSTGAKMASKADDVISEASLLPETERIGNITSKLSGIWGETKGLIGKGLMKSDQAITAIFATSGEAAIEALNNSQEFRKKMVDDFVATYGRKPGKDDMDVINAYAEQVGAASYWANIGLLSVTNYIQLPKIFSSSFKSEKNIMNQIAFKGGEYASSLPEKGFGKLFYKSRHVAQLFFNTAEAFEEGAQYAIQTGTENYYGKQRKGKETTSAMDDGILYGIKQALTTDEGLLNIVTGGLSGAIMSSGVAGINERGIPVIGKTGKIGERGLTGYGGEMGRQRQAAIDALNNSRIKDGMRDAYSDIKAAEIIQQDRMAAIRQGDILEAKDLEFDYAHNFITTRLKYGAKQLIDDEIADLKQQASTPEGFSKLKEGGYAAETDTIGSFITRLDNLQEQANLTERLYKEIHLKYDGETKEIEEEGKKKKVKKYSDLVIDKLVYAAAKVANYDGRIPQLSTELLSSGIDVSAVLSDIIENNKPNEEATKAALDKINALDIIDEKKNDLKTKLQDVIELSLRRKLFIDEYRNIKEKPDNYNLPIWQEIENVPTQATVSQKEGRKTTEKELEVGKEYSIDDILLKEDGKLHLSPKITILSKSLGGEYQVKLPSGETRFMSPQEFKKYKISDLDNTSAKLSEIMDSTIDDVLKRPKYKSIEKAPATEKLKYINSIENKSLINDVEKEFRTRIEDIIKKEEEDRRRKAELLKNKEEIDKQQKDIELSSGIPTKTIISDDDLKGQGKLKHYAILFTSTTTESETYQDPHKSADHIKRSRYFLNNAKRFKNRRNLRSILATAKNAESLGLKGIVQLSYGKDNSVDVNSIEGVNDVDNGFIGSVFVEQDRGKLYFVDKNGERIKGDNGKAVQVGEQVDVAQVIFQTMPTTSLYQDFDKTKLRCRKEQLKEAEAASVAWKEKRKEILSSEGGPVITYSFSISRGIPIEIYKEEKGVKIREKNHVGETLVPEELIAKLDGLLNVVTTESVFREGEGTEGENIKFPNGLVVLKYGDTLQVLTNTLLGESRAKAVYRVIKLLAEEMESKKRINPAYAKYLQSVLYWRKSDKTEKNQIYVDMTDATISIGGKKYSITQIADSEKEITDYLKDVYHHINKKVLEDNSVAFYDYELEKEWTNYQEYLLASKTPDGKARASENTPLVTSVAKPSSEPEGLPYNYMQKYAILNDLDLAIKLPEKEATPEEAAKGTPEGTAIGPYDATGKVNTIPLQQGNLEFTLKLDTKGNPIISIVQNETVKKIAENKELMEKAILPALSTLGYNLSELNLSNEKAVSLYLKNKVNIEFLSPILNKEEEEKSEEKESAPSPQKKVKKPVAKPVEEIDPRKNIVINNLKDRSGHLRIQTDTTDTIDYHYDFEIVNGIAVKGVYSTFFAGEYRDREEKKELKNSQDELEKLLGKKYIYDEHLSKSSSFSTKDKKFSLEELSTEPSDKPIDISKTEEPDDDYRRVGEREEKKSTISDSDLTFFKAYVEEVVPNLPYEVLESLVTTYDNEKAYGVFENGVAKFFRGAIRGTEYHEIMEGIWKHFLSNDEREAILNELREKKGFFKDRQTRKKIAYIDATDQQLKEKVMDDFADYRVGKLPARNLGEAIVKFFRRIIEFFKSFVSKPSLKQQMFEAIDKGRFRESVIVKKDATPEYSRIPGITEQQAFQYAQDIAIRAANIIFGEDKINVFDIDRVTSDEIFGQIKDLYTREKKYQQLGEERWQRLVKRAKQLMRPMGVSFYDMPDINEEGRDQVNYAPEPFSTDWKQTSNFCIKLLTMTLPKTKTKNQERKSTLDLPKKATSSVKGYLLVNFSKVFSSVLHKLANKTNVSEMEQSLVELIKGDSDLVRLFTRVGGILGDEENNPKFNFEDFNSSDWRLFVNFYQTFTKQKPEMLVQYSEGSETYIGTADIFGAVEKMKRQWIEQLKILAADPKSAISWNSAKKVYKFHKKAANYPESAPKKAEDAVKFLNSLGIDFSIELFTKLKSTLGKRERKTEQAKFFDAVSAIYRYLQDADELVSLNDKTLKIAGQFSKLAELSIKASSPVQENTHFNLDGNKIQNFAENNVPSIFENDFNSVETDNELKEKRTELNDVYATNSVVLKRGGLFVDKNGKIQRRLKVRVLEGESDKIKNQGKTVTKLTIGNRFVAEINQNINGTYYVLIPADGATEWAMNLGNHITFTDITSGNAGWDKIYSIFNGYLKDEIGLALDWKNRSTLAFISEARAKQLRFFKDILSSSTLSKINEMIESGELYEDIIEFISKDEIVEDINNSVKEFIEQMNSATKEALVDSEKIIRVATKDGKNSVYAFPKLDSVFTSDNHINKFNLTEDGLNEILSFVNVNYIINNTEFHKLIYGDPYQFEEKNGRLDETKRIKSSLSPRRTTFDSVLYNAFLNTEYNKIGDITLDDKELGHHKFRSYIKTVTLADVNLSTDLFPKINEANGFSMIMDNSYREVKLKNGQWGNKEEEWHQWQMAYTRQHLPGYIYQDRALAEKDVETLKKAEPKHVIDVMKPIVFGTKFGATRIDLVLDKFSQMPLYYKAIERTALAKLYEKMWREDIGYVVMESGRKVGVTEKHSLYKNGEFNTAPFNNIINVGWNTYGIQVETSYSEKNQTMGSQLTKLASLDLFEFGAPISENAGKVYDKNLSALKNLQANLYSRLLKRLGLTDEGSYFTIDKTVIQDTLEHELLRRELPQNVIDTIHVDEETGDWLIPFEASTHYTQIRDILFSIVNKSIISPKLNGRSKTQVPVTLWENAEEGRGLIIKDGDKWRKISSDEYEVLSGEEKKNVRLTSGRLKFYTKDAPYCEVLLPHWFKERLTSKKYDTDEKLLAYLNSTEEGRSILTGIGFRIPTQAMASIEVFRVAGFLPAFMGDTVVVPSEIEAKAGSDFDIDKLNTYLKSIYLDENGDIKLIRYQGSEEATKQFFSDVYSNTIHKEIAKITKYDKFRDKLVNLFEKLETLDDFSMESIENLLSEEEYEFYNYHYTLLQTILEQCQERRILPSTYIKQQIETLGEKEVELTIELLDNQLREDYVESMYEKALENEYYESMEKMLQLPENFDRWMTPIGNAGLKQMSDKLDKLRGVDETSVKARMLNRKYLTTLRHSFLLAKKWVGIAAVNITGQAVMQKAGVYVDSKRFYMVPKDRAILGNGTLTIPHNTIIVDGKEYITISGRTTVDGKQFISDRLSGYITSFVDVAKDPYITKIITSDSVVGAFMFLERIGAGETGIMFLSQPIIQRYLSIMSNKETKNLYNKKNIERIREEFGGDLKYDEGAYTVDNFEENIEQYSRGQVFTAKQNAEQQAIFDEFLKVCKMAEHSFKLTQATNYDTTRIRSSSTYLKKTVKTQEARENNIFSSVDRVLETTHLGALSENIDGIISAMGEIMKTEKEEIRSILDNILLPYIADPYMSNDDFERIGNKLKASFLDYIISRKLKLDEDRIKLLVVDPKTSVATQLSEAKKRHPEMEILQHLQVETSRIGSLDNNTKTVTLDVMPDTAFDKDFYVGMMRELKEVEPALFDDLVLLSIIQGIYKSSVSIKDIIPVEDYSEKIKPIIDTLTNTPEVEEFIEGWFQRNNWKDDDAVPTVHPKFFIEQDPATREEIYREDEYGNSIFAHFSYAFMSPYLTNLGVKPHHRALMFLDERYNSSDIIYDYLKVPRMVVDQSTGERIDLITGETITPGMIRAKLEKGDYSYFNMFGYKKVKYDNGEPVINSKGEHIYKLVNLYGDGQYASEYYPAFSKSVLNNGTRKVENELEDANIIKYYGTENRDNFYTPDKKLLTPIMKNRIINVNQFKITLKPDGSMFFDNGTEVTDQTIKNKANIRKELQDGTLRTSVFNRVNYFILSDNRILGGGKTNLGKESITDVDIAKKILDKAVLYKKQC